MEKQTFNLNTILLLIVLAGLVVLYILFFTSKPTGEVGVMEEDSTMIASASGPDIVYVNIDTLNEYYEFVKVLKRNLESTGNRLQREVLNEQDALEKEAAAFQQKISTNSITEERARVVYEELMAKQQTLMEKKDRYTQLIAEQEFNMNIQLLDTVNNFLLRFNREYQYNYILAFRTAGEILVASDSLDITRQVLDQLNEEYASRKK
ncbi:MAG: OmpH family outer membrane protein [Bacteroidales bacterium]|nr:OmpH family outer membrane protein [Bacteroidales bacterium]